MTHAVLHKYINYTVDKLLSPALVTNFITNCSIIATATIIIMVIMTLIIIIIIIIIIVITIF